MPKKTNPPSTVIIPQAQKDADSKMTGSKKLKIALVTEAYYAPPKEAWISDRILETELKKTGHHIDRIDWRDKSVNPQDYDALFLTSCWNFHEHTEEFFKWLGQCEADGKKRLINDREVIDDNIVKSRYLSYLEGKIKTLHDAKGILTPTKFYAVSANEKDGIESTKGKTLDSLLQELDHNDQWKGQDIVIKPIVSADGKDTFVYTRSKRELKNIQDDHLLKSPLEAQKHFDHILATESAPGVILQPYMPAIEKGEYQLVFSGDKFTHAVRKPDGFRNAHTELRVEVTKKQLPPHMLDFCLSAIRPHERKICGWCDNTNKN